MSKHWTAFDPGAGDTSESLNAATWCERQVAKLEEVEAAANSVLSGLDDAWRGMTAVEFRLKVTALKTRALSDRDTHHEASKLFKRYADTVDQIASEATPWRETLSAAQAVVSAHFVSIASQADFDARLSEYQRASRDLAEATEQLGVLAERRLVADQDLARGLAVEASEAWGDISGMPAGAADSFRARTNDQVMGLFDTFRTGEGPTGVVMGGRDPFVQQLMTSSHVDSVRARVLAGLRDGSIAPGKFDSNGDGIQDSQYDFSRSISNDPGVLVRDMITVGNSMMTGSIPDHMLMDDNMPESFLGSYQLNVYTEAPAADGSVTVTYAVSNATSIDSFTRIPGTGGSHLPVVHESMNLANSKSGEWETQRQIIVWSEKVYP